MGWDDWTWDERLRQIVARAGPHASVTLVRCADPDVEDAVVTRRTCPRQLAWLAP
jgi:hypothetical protein